MRVGVSDSEVVESFARAHEDSEVRKLARVHTNSAVSTLVRLMKSTKTPAGVRRQCAADLLAQGWGRPDAREDGGAAPKAGLVINILKLSTGMIESIAQTSEDALNRIDAADVARFIAAETANPTRSDAPMTKARVLDLDAFLEEP